MILDGKKMGDKIREEIKNEIFSLTKRKPGLTVLLVGENPASLTYVNAKKKACIEAGMVSEIIHLPNTIREIDLIQEIEKLNRNPNVDGILVQLPLPSHINAALVTSTIDPKKDVDGFHPINMGKLLLGQEDGFQPCTPLGIITLLEKSKIEVKGKHVVILGRSNIVGKPLAAMLLQNRKGCNATVTLLHNQSQNALELTKSADILISAIGKPRFIKEHMVKENAVVIDVGINREGKKIVGDVDFEHVSKKASAITPVPGGIGPMTIAMLLKNTLKAFTKALVFLLLLHSCQSREGEDPCTYFRGLRMKANYQIAIGEKISEEEQKMIEEVISETFTSYENHFDLENPTSEIAILNSAVKDTLIPLSLPMQNILELSQKIVSISNSRFDPTIEPLREAWEKSEDPNLEEGLEATGWKHISVQNGIFRKDCTGTKLNLGAIFKGQLVDALAETLLKLGYSDFLIEWAGNYRAHGHHPNSDWVVEINPALTINNQSIAPIPLRDAAIASSGSHFFHIIDPTTAYPIQKTDFSIASATVIAPTCALADGLATAAMLFCTRKEAEDWAQEVVDHYQDVSFWIISYKKE